MIIKNVLLHNTNITFSYHNHFSYVTQHFGMYIVIII